jgi:beta-1,4-mannosyl-glycoprotein beta-1,4-N-acetylglucosaminyltransferase
MRSLVDCFLYNDERELLEIRLRLLSNIVSRFVIVWSPWTFTGRKKEQAFPWDSEVIERYRERISLITLEQIEGKTGWEKERTSRNAIQNGLAGLNCQDIVMISDIDEIPRPDRLKRMMAEGIRATTVLGLDYFNFKFNYQLVHGPQSVWPGPILCAASDYTNAQDLRDLRWQYVTKAANEFVYRGGWHFSFLTRTDDVKPKLASFSHQESAIQRRTDSVADLITSRRGFHDHLHPCTVWAVVSNQSFQCDELAKLVAEYPQFLLPNPPDDQEQIDHEIRMSVIRMLKGPERTHIMNWCTHREILEEVGRRISARIRRVLPGNGALR